MSNLNDVNQYKLLGEFAIDYGKQCNVNYIDFRFEKHDTYYLSLKDSKLESDNDLEDYGIGVRVIYNNAWGFASVAQCDKKSIKKTIDNAILLAKISNKLVDKSVILADEPVYSNQQWSSQYEQDPFKVSNKDKIGLLESWSLQLLKSNKIDHVEAMLMHVKEFKYYCNNFGTSVAQERIRIHSQLSAVKLFNGNFEILRTIAPPAAKGWEYMLEPSWNKEISEMPDKLEEKVNADTVEGGEYNLLIDPTNLWLTIHESIGHATEYDRILGYEAAYAGTSFIKTTDINKLQYGSNLLNVTGDRVDPYGLATVGYDDDGVKTKRWNIITNGILSGFQLDRRMAYLRGEHSNGCAYADSYSTVPLQRMANVSMQPDINGPNKEEMIKSIKDGIYVVGDNSWSIDMQRRNFQFTGQLFYRIKNGNIVGQVKDIAYQSNTLKFWNSLRSVGNKSTYSLNGAMNCGKAQPGQVAPVGHGAPLALFENVNIINTKN